MNVTHKRPRDMDVDDDDDKCRYCGSNDIHTDHVSGDTTCHGCAAVLSSGLIDTTQEWRRGGSGNLESDGGCGGGAGKTGDISSSDRVGPMMSTRKKSATGASVGVEPMKTIGASSYLQRVMKSRRKNTTTVRTTTTTTHHHHNHHNHDYG